MIRSQWVGVGASGLGTVNSGFQGRVYGRRWRWESAGPRRALTRTPNTKSPEQTPEWLDSDSCQKCDQPFFWNFKQMWDSKKIGLRQHHCRKCGKAVCGKCSSKRSSIPLMGFEFEVRVCDSCHESITDEERAPTATFHDSKHNIVHVHFDATRGWLLTSGTDKVIKLWDMTPVVS